MFLGEFVEVSYVPDKGLVVELLYGGVAGYHIHRLAAEEVYKTSLDLGRTAGLVRAEGLCFLFVPYQWGAAVRAVFREMRECHVRFASAQLDPCDLRDDLSSFLDIDVVSDVDVQNLHLVCVVEGCTFHDCAAELHRLEIGYRSHSSCAAHLIVDAQELGESLLCLEFVGYGPSRELGCVAQFFLIWQFVYLNYDSVCSERKCFAFCVPVLYESLYLLDAPAHLSLVRDRQAPALCCPEGLVVGVERQILAENVVEGAFQTSVCDHLAVDELEGARSGVSWVGKRLFLLVDTLFVQAVEGCPRHIDLSSDLKLLRPRLRLCEGRDEARRCLEFLRDVADALHVFGDVVSDLSVTACQRPCESSVFVCKAYSCAVELELAAEGEGVAYALDSSVSELLHLSDVVGVAEGQHRVAVGMLLEFLSGLFGFGFSVLGFRCCICSLEEVTSYILCGRVRCGVLRVFLFQPLKFLEEHIEFVVAQCRGVLHIVPSVGLCEDLFQFLYSYVCLCFLHSYKILQKYSFPATSATKD